MGQTLPVPVLSPGGLRPWQGRLLLTVGAQLEQAEQNLVPLDFKRDLDIVDSEKETVNDMIATYGGD